MTKNNEEIRQLKYEQTQRKEKIETFRKRMRKHIFLLSLATAVFAFLCLEDAYKTFGSVTNFLIIVFSVFAILSMTYFFVVRFLIKQEEREIKIIRSKLYRLMKLENE